ncbi:Actin cytoskeleton-regulatory complex protein pan1 [Hypsizygus marmoreus]|uniref:Actin cytoskeleton-regulatory complex protein PAN1 n=1 Tax=Hypsizygus marmoreus TaxID=39966 RepID=A0A369JFG2_HYPMA|nr:Actin cytoskeleton-regulatory complex protein pan1 [Hypsizygus marmoreus]
MSQWGQAQQPGFQYPMQTGFPGANPQFQQQQNPQFQQQNPQFQQQNPAFQQQGGFGGGGLAPQPTGFPGQQRLQGFQQPQQTGYQGGQGFLQSQPTGFPPPGGNFQQQQPRLAPPPPVPPIPTQFQQSNQTSGFLGLPQQQQQISRFQSSSPGIGGPGLVPQATGFPGRVGGGQLVPQMTGYVDPRLQMMSNTFMPMNGTSFGAGAAPQLAPPQFNLQQSIQQHNQAQRGTPTTQMSWALTKAEKKQYNDIFRSWDAQNTGFISGQTALEVFGASGLPKDDLARIWTLADIDDRGKLNIAEFHVAMGLIYRRLSGMPVPEQLPPELLPPSARDLDNSVDMMKDLLKHESRARSPSTLDAPISKLKNRSLNRSSPTLGSGRDATIYKHTDTEPVGGVYHSRSRHINRDDVRSRSDDDSPSAELSDMKRRLANTAQMLDRNAEADAARTEEDEELDREMDDLKYRVKRVSDDLEYVSRGPRTASKDQERRKLERELLELMHERVPEVERKIKARDERKEREKRQWARDRDRANDRFGRYDAKDDSSSRRYDDRDRDRPYSRGYDRDGDRDTRDDDRGSYRRDARSRSRDRDYDRPRTRSPPAPRSPPPPPPSNAPPRSISAPLTAPPPPKATPSPAPLKNMTPEERQAYARAEAKRRIEARMAALGVTAPSSPIIDTSVEDRLQQEKKEAEEKARAAEKQAEERDRLRKERLENDKAAKDGKAPPSPIPPAAPTPTPTRTVQAPTAPAPAPTPRSAPQPSKPRAPAPPPPRKAPASRLAPAAAATPPAPKPPVVSAPPPEPEVDPEEERLRAREEAIRKQREARAEKLRQLEKEEEEAARLEEEKYQARLKALKAKTTPSPSPAFTSPAPPAVVKAPTPPPAAPAAPPPPPPPAAPAAPAAPPPPPPAPAPPAIDTTKSTNPFSRLIKEGATAAAPAAATNGTTNPWARPQTAPPPSAPSPPRSPGPKSYNTAPSSAIEDDWDDIKENVEDDSSDDEFSGRGRREDIARQLFGSILPTSRPQSAAAVAKPATKPSSPASAPAPPPPPPAPPAPTAGAPFAPPPPAPPAPAVPAIAAGSPDRSGLMKSIQGGLKLKHAKTVDKSAPPVSGRVLGDTAPPAHINAAPRPASPPARAVTPPPAPAPAHEQYQQYEQHLPEPAAMDQGSSKSSNRQSVGWFAERAADAGSGVEVQRLPSTNEESEEDEDIYASPPSAVASIPAIHIEEAASTAPDPLADIDKSITHRARTLYAFEGEGPDDLSFGENLVLTVNPSKTGGDWWYGTLVNTGKSGVFPKTYIEVVKPVKARALYTYTGNNPDELPFTEGDVLSIIDTSEEEWWKTEQGGVVFIVPAGYLEIVEG